MAMFKEKKAAATDTLIGQGTITEGKMICEANLRIEGEYRGEIECRGDVTIGENGLVRSSIIAQDLTIAGKVYGDVTTKGRLIITASGHLSGSITANSLIIQEGGTISGTFQMASELEGKSNDGSDTPHSAHGKEPSVKEIREKSRQAG